MSRVSKKVFALLLVVLLITSVVGCSQEKDTGATTKDATTADTKAKDATAEESPAETIKIGLVTDLTGAEAYGGMMDQQGARLAVQWVNDRGGIKSLNGAKLELVEGDCMSDTTAAKEVTERLLNSHDIVAMTGTGNSHKTLAILPTIEKAQVPLLVVNFSQTIVTSGYKYVFMQNGTGDMHSALQVEFLKWMNDKYNLKNTKVAVVYEDTDFGRSGGESTGAIAEQTGMEVVFSGSFPVGTSDLSSLVLNLKQLGAQVLFITAQTAECKILMSNMASMDYHPLIVGSGSSYILPNFAEDMGEEAIGVVATGACIWDSKNNMENPETKEFFELFCKTYNVNYIPERAISSSNNIFIIAKALEECGSTEGPVLRDAISNLKVENFVPGGPLNYNEGGWNQNAVVTMGQWQKMDGKLIFRMVYPEEWATVGFELPEALKAN